ncbi:MAG: hypothetical protein K9K37_01225 [Desulfocapsa sp.]|nr:hypothetical protein [Desulfocapsa sp.]
MQHELHIENIRVTRKEATQRLSADFKIGRKRSKVIWFETDLDEINISAEPFLPVALAPAMRRGWQLIVDGALSSQLMKGAEQIQQILNEWYPSFEMVPLSCSDPYLPAASGSNGQSVAAFFSGGVDSFYTLQSHLDEIDQLIFVHGFDIPLKKNVISAQAAHSVRTLADRLGLKLVEVKTNLREFGQGRVSWADAYFGAALAAVALLLAPRFKRIYLPASVSVEELQPMGSHPDMDNHWSNSEMELIHDGVEATRFRKVQAISHWVPVSEHLRVCYLNNNGRTNCGHCQKCLWTMMMLRAVGCLDGVSTFQSELDLQELQLYVPVTSYQVSRFKEALAALKKRNADPLFAEILHKMLLATGNTPLKGRLKRQLERCRIYLSHFRPVLGEKN